MKKPATSSLLSLCFLFLFVQDGSSLTMQGLFRKLKERRVSEDRPVHYPEPYPEEAAAADSISQIRIRDKSFIRPIASIAGRPVIPRRWTYGQPISDVFVDENGIAFPVRPQPSLNSILKGRGGIY